MNRHFHKSSLIRRSDLKRLSEQDNSLISRYGAERDEDVVIRGDFSFHRFVGGLSIHCSQATEQKDCSNCFELPPGLSFNFIFRGTVDVSLAGHSYRFPTENNTSSSSCTIASIALSQSDILLRHMRKGMILHKVNIFVTRQWLESHCAVDTGYGFIDALFEEHARVREWMPSSSLSTRAAEWFDLVASDTATGHLELEWKAISLLSKTLEEYKTVSKIKSVEQHSRRSTDRKNLKLAVDSCMSTCGTVKEVAQTLHLSPSTLQRRFRHIYNMTVVDYMRLRRLEQAKVAIMRDGATIGEAAYLAGYNHASNFITAFRKNFSVTPMALMRSQNMDDR